MKGWEPGSLYTLPNVEWIAYISWYIEGYNSSEFWYNIAGRSFNFGFAAMRSDRYELLA